MFVATNLIIVWTNLPMLCTSLWRRQPKSGLVIFMANFQTNSLRNLPDATSELVPDLKLLSIRRFLAGRRALPAS